MIREGSGSGEEYYVVVVAPSAEEVLLAKNVSDSTAVKTRERSYLLAITVLAMGALLDSTTLMLPGTTLSSTGRLLWTPSICSWLVISSSARRIAHSS